MYCNMLLQSPLLKNHCIRSSQVVFSQWWIEIHGGGLVWRQGWKSEWVVKRSKWLVQTHRQKQSQEQDWRLPLLRAWGDPRGHTAAVSRRPCTPAAASHGTLQRGGAVSHTDTNYSQNQSVFYDTDKCGVCAAYVQYCLMEKVEAELQGNTAWRTA